jgi:hypothetical protein
MIKRIVQTIKTQKNGEIREILRRPDGKKKSRLRAWLGGQIGWEARLDYTLSFT